MASNKYVGYGDAIKSSYAYKSIEEKKKATFLLVFNSILTRTEKYNL